MSFSELFKKPKYFSGFCISLTAVILCYFLLDQSVYSVSKRQVFTPGSKIVTLSKEIENPSEKNVEFLSEKGNACDVFDGDWVWDDEYPLYHSENCSFLDYGFRCSENGRIDWFYMKWRWQPKLCNLPRFNATLLLEKLRNKRVIFAGDSLGRNQWESLLCLLSSATPNKDSIYEVNGNPVTKHNGFLSFMFRDFNTTISYYRAPFLVLQRGPPHKLPKKVKFIIRLDQMDWTSREWKKADVLVLNTGHWWNYEKTIKGGSYFQIGRKVEMEMKAEDAFRRSIQTVHDWMQSELNFSKTTVFFRTFSPIHFRGGNWRTGGYCHLETLPDVNPSLVPAETWTHLKLVTDGLSRSDYPYPDQDIHILNITALSAQRKDGHSSIYYLGPGFIPMTRQDCSHWCLPGVPDTWNELLGAILLKQDSDHKP